MNQKIGYPDLLLALKEVNMVRHWPMFANHVEPVGKLPDTPAGHAVWFYCRCCVGLFRELDAGSAEYADELDHTNMQANILMSTAALYHLESPSEILRLLPLVKEEVHRIFEESGVDIGYDVRFEQVDRSGQRERDN